MVDWNTGSITTHVGNIIGWTNIPSGISGTTLNNMAEQEINFAELYTTDTINSTTIAEKYQPAIIDLLLSKLMILIEIQGGGVDSISLGELNVGQGQGGNAELAAQLRIDAVNRLKELGRSIRFARVHGA